ncbi:MAG: response regulator transcription factor [Salinivirgaceae bacterium]|jgi:DNA-binding NarL/FixJ family response regulator|nr:response regulator transcription factor [Salinivirgaceae bacterium]
MNKTKIKAVIVDDHEMFRSGLKSLLEQENLAQVVAEASNGQEFLELMGTLSPDLILMDIDMPLMNGIEASEKALAKNPKLNILVLSMYDDYSHYTRLVTAGVKGFISKSSGKTDLERGIMAVSNGDSYFSSDLLRNIIIEINKPKERVASKGSAVTFSSREEEVLKLICNGYATNEIADKLCLSHKTIDNHRSKLLQKAGVKNSIGLVIYAIKNKIVIF